MEFSSADFPNRFDFATAQPRLYQFWESRGYFHSEPDPDGKKFPKGPFTIVIPPPNVTGALHLGHALNNTLQDILIRMKRMQGFNALWMPGTDHAGIATQAVVEKRLKEEEGKTRHDLGREKLVERIWQWKEQYEARILGQLKQMGCSCDWQRTRFTLDEGCSRAVRQTFFDLFQKGLIYRGKRLVNWDTYLQTAVSDDELFHDPVKGHFWHFRYPVIDPQPGEPTHVTIATTRPETMLGDTAVAVHPDPARALDKAEAELAEKLAAAPTKEKSGLQSQIDAIRQRRLSMLPQLEKLRDMALDGRKLRLPLANREIPLICDEWAKPELGSGCVKITPAHDQNDYEVWQRHPEIGAINIMNPDGTLNDSVPEKYRGLKMHTTARQQVVEDLIELGLHNPETEREDREIDIAHSDRSKTPIEPYLTEQWFVEMDQLAQSAMDAVTDGRVKIFPSRYAKSYLDWLDEKRDWCVSRNLWWGHRIPVWSKVTESIEKAATIDRRISKHTLIEAASAEGRLQIIIERSPQTSPGKVWASGREIASQVPQDTLIHICVRDDDEPLVAALERDFGFVQDEGVLDTWFSSQLWPHSTLGWPEKTPELAYYYPTSALITSRDIITLWVARMVLAGLNNMGEVPFRQVFIHPKILDGYGETMSKSKGNGIDPLDVIDKFGADALRFGMAYLTTETQDVRMPVQFECPHCEALIEQTKKNRELPRIACSKCGKEFSTQWATTEKDKALPRGPVVSERFEVARNFCNKLWNASRFALLNLTDFEPGGVDDDELAIEDRWILSRLATVTQAVTQSLETYHFADAARALYDFAWDEFCSFYVEMLKDRFQDAQKRPIAQRIMAHTLDTLLRLLHPMIPFITEEVWQLFAKIAPRRGLPESQDAAESIMIAAWPQADLSRQDSVIETRFAKFQAVLGAIREIKSGKNIAPKETIEFSVRCDEETAALLAPMQGYFESMPNGGKAVGWGTKVEPPKHHATVSLPGMDVYLDLTNFIDAPAEIARLEKEEQQLQGHIAGKEKKLANASFVDKAPAQVVQEVRDGLAANIAQLKSVQASLAALRDMK